MSRRFQFSLKWLLAFVSLAALPPWAYAYLRDRGDTLEFIRSAAGQPITIRATYFWPTDDEFGEVFFFVHERPRGQEDCILPRPIKMRRSWLICSVAETTVPLLPPGSYYVRAISRRDGSMTREFTVEAPE
jgi:hypothetical protein